MITTKEQANAVVKEIAGEDFFAGVAPTNSAKAKEIRKAIYPYFRLSTAIFGPRGCPEDVEWMRCVYTNAYAIPMDFWYQNMDASKLFFIADLRPYLGLEHKGYPEILPEHDPYIGNIRVDRIPLYPGWPGYYPDINPNKPELQFRKEMVNNIIIPQPALPEYYLGTWWYVTR